MIYTYFVLVEGYNTEPTKFFVDVDLTNVAGAQNIKQKIREAAADHIGVEYYQITIEELSFVCNIPTS